MGTLFVVFVSVILGLLVTAAVFCLGMAINEAKKN